MKKTKIDQDKIRDIAIKCVDEMVHQGIIKDCIDTDDSTEFDIQDIIVDTLLKEELFKNKCDELLNRSCELLCELEEGNKYFYDFDGGEEQKERVDKFFEDVKKHNEPKDSSNTKQSALADIEGLDMIKDSLCVECDNYIDYSELKDGMCSKCGETLEECSMNFDTFNEESFEEEFINLFNKYYYVKSDKPFFDYEEGDENGDLFEDSIEGVKKLIRNSYKK